MAYTKQTWQDNSGAHPASAGRFGYMENGIEAAHLDLASHAADKNLHGNRAVGWIEHSGHSIAAAAGINPVHSYGRKLAGLIGTTRYRSIALSGAMAARETRNMGGDGGFPWILQNITRPNVRPLQPRGQLVIVDLGWNDKAIMGPNDTPMREALRAIYARYRSALVFENDDPIMALGGGATASANTSYNSGAGFVTLDAAGETVTITLPSWYDGRKLDFGFIVNSTITGTARVVVDGGAPTDWVLDGAVLAETGRLNGVIRTLTLSPGAHTIVISRNAGAAVYFDYMAMRVLDSEGPVLVIPKNPKMADYSLYSGYTYPMNDTRVDELHAALDAVAAEFPKTLTVNLDPVYNKNPDLLVAPTDPHPNERGHSVIAAELHDKIQDSGLLETVVLDAGSVDHTEYFEPVFPAGSTGGRVVFQNSWVNFAGGFEDAGFRMDELGQVVLRGVVKSGSAANAVMFTLPPGYRPRRGRAFPQIANNALCRIDIGTDGTVRAISGGSTVFTVLDGIRFAGER